MDGKLQGNEMNNNNLPNTQPRETIFSSHLSPTIQCGGAVAAERQSGRWISAQSYLPSSGGGSGGPLKGWGHFLCLRALAGKIKCLHSVSPALFQMPSLPFKRPLWARMANERFWVLAIYSFLSLPFCHSQSPPPHSICDVKPKSLLYFCSLCESAETDI